MTFPPLIPDSGPKSMIQSEFLMISKLCSMEKINILAVEHIRFTLDLSVRAARLNITLETQDKKHANKIIYLIKKLGFKVREKVEN